MGMKITLKINAGRVQLYLQVRLFCLMMRLAACLLLLLVFFRQNFVKEVFENYLYACLIPPDDYAEIINGLFEMFWDQIAVSENNILRVFYVFCMFSGIDELLAQDTSSYQLFHSLPKEMQEK